MLENNDLGLYHKRWWAVPYSGFALMKRVIRLFPSPWQALKGAQIPECYARSHQGRAIVRLHLRSPAALLMPFEDFPTNFGRFSPHLLHQDFYVFS
jgi:hypothetical protein